jgi:hypothetical protein
MPRLSNRRNCKDPPAALGAVIEGQSVAVMRCNDGAQGIFRSDRDHGDQEFVDQAFE